MRLLFAIPHYFDAAGDGSHASLGGAGENRVRTFADCLATLRQQFGRPQCTIDIARRTTFPTNKATATHLDVIVCTTGKKHLLDRLPFVDSYFIHHPTIAEPALLGLECHAVLRDRLGDYDFYCYLEDDLVIRDPWFFVKMRWFTAQFGDDALLMPNRYEVARDQIVHRAYVDGPLRPAVTAAFQNVADTPILEGEALGQRVVFERTTNPHSGGFFLNGCQMEKWAAMPFFLDRDVRFIGALESAASLGVMRTFRIYKPAADNGAFLEVEHPGAKFLTLIRMPQPGEATSTV
jgi:hypothetical protein